MAVPAAPTVSVVQGPSLGVLSVTIASVGIGLHYRLYRGTATAPTTQRGSDVTVDPPPVIYDSVTQRTVYYYRAKAVSVGTGAGGTDEVSAYGPEVFKEAAGYTPSDPPVASHDITAALRINRTF